MYIYVRTYVPMWALHKHMHMHTVNVHKGKELTLVSLIVRTVVVDVTSAVCASFLITLTHCRLG